MKNRTRGGFTLAELLIVVAIIGALVAVAVPVFGTQLEKSRQAVDVANMRSAYSAAIAQYLSTGAAVEGYFDGGGVTSARPARGYGRSGTNVSAFTTKFWDGVKVKASGVPNKDGTANYLSVKVDGDGGVTLAWGSGATISSKIVAGGTPIRRRSALRRTSRCWTRCRRIYRI